MLSEYIDENAAVRLLRADVRILHRLNLNRRAAAANENAGTKIGAVVDCETTGLDIDSSIIELSIRRFKFDDSGTITKLDQPYGWLEDPGRPLDPAISALTGLTDADLRDKRIDDAAATTLLNSAHVRVAFNAGFDRKFVERRLPDVAGRPWACAMREIDWRGRGFDGSGRSLGWILAQCGLFSDCAHNAAGDVDATVAILEHRHRNGETALFELLETASQPTCHVRAVGAAFCVRTALKSRGYRWDADEAVWWREVSNDALADEKAWLAVNVYAPEHTPRMDCPLVREVTWETRHG